MALDKNSLAVKIAVPVVSAILGALALFGISKVRQYKWPTTQEIIGKICNTKNSQDAFLKAAKAELAAVTAKAAEKKAEKSGDTELTEEQVKANKAIDDAKARKAELEKLIPMLENKLK